MHGLPGEITYNVSHPIMFEDSPGWFKVYDPAARAIATTSDTVIFLETSASFDCLTYRDIFARAVLRAFVAANDTSEGNMKRFGGKRILTCVLALSHAEPVWIDVCKMSKDSATVRECIRAAIDNRLTRTNDSVWALYMRCLDDCPQDVRAAREHMLKRLKDYNGPMYAKNFFQNITRSKVARREDFDVAFADAVDDWLIALKSMRQVEE